MRNRVGHKTITFFAQLKGFLCYYLLGYVFMLYNGMCYFTLCIFDGKYSNYQMDGFAFRNIYMCHTAYIVLTAKLCYFSFCKYSYYIFIKRLVYQSIIL